jgi:alpha-mannosidase
MMKRRDFLKHSGLLPVAAGSLFTSVKLLGADAEPLPNPNWADAALGAKAHASSAVDDPPKGYQAANVFGPRVHNGWQSNGESAGAWLEITFAEPKPVRELWVLAAPLESGIVGEDPYTMAFPRQPLHMAPRKVRISFSNGGSHSAELRQFGGFQIITLPRTESASAVRITVEDVWPKPGGKETGLGKVRVFARAHEPAFEVVAHRMYDAHDGKPVQAATLTLVNPGAELRDAALQVVAADGAPGSAPAKVPLRPVLAQSVTAHEVWIPAPFEDAEMEFAVAAQSARFETRRKLRVPKYHSLFDGGTFEIDCTNHNDLGWLSTQKITAGYRSESLILPAMELMKKYPEFLYSMECTAYLMEFLERHPDRRGEIAELMRQRRFIFGASYVQLLEYSAGPEKLARQFYLGRRWLKKTFPGVDSRFYIQTDPPSLTQQMPQLLALAGVKYCLLGRMPFGFFDWQSPDGTSIRVFGYRYYDAGTLLDPTDTRGWLRFADEREAYYEAHHMPRRFIYDYTSDYLPPQPEIVPYARRENARMQAFAKVWNAHFAGEKSSHIDPPRIGFTTPEKYLDALEKEPVELTTLRGEWPMNWAYYDEPSNRKALLDGRHAHNELLAAERAFAAAGTVEGFAGYPVAKFEAAWQANLWPDHGWGGNRGVETDQVYADSYAKSKRIAAELLASAGAKLAPRQSAAPDRMPVTVFNPLSWPRTDLAEFEVRIPAEWPGWSLADDQGREVRCAVQPLPETPGTVRLAFVATEVPAVGCRSFVLRRAPSAPPADAALTGEHLENSHYLLAFGAGGIKRLYDKARQVEVLRTAKYEGGEVLQFTALGAAWEDPQAVSLTEFDRTSNHEFPIVSLRRTPIGAVAVREAKFKHFTLRQQFKIYDELPRVDTDIELLDWDGSPEIELRAVFPVNLDEARLSYETPFGAAEVGKDEIDYTRLPSNAASQFYPQKYGGDHALAFRQAINWIDASSPNFASSGVMAASDTTVHLFRDPAESPVGYPVLQHVLLASRKSMAWNPQYWFTQKGTHRYRMTLLPHGGDWRERYRDAIGYNYRLSVFTGEGAASGPGLELAPHSLVLTAFKKSEEDGRLVIRFYEAEGNRSHAHIKLRRPIRRAWRTNLIEDDETPLRPLADGSLEFPVRACEIVTLKLEV